MTLSSPEARALAREIARLQRQITDLQRAPQLAYSSIDDASLDVVDADGQIRMTIGQQPDGTYTAVDRNGPPPPQPGEADVEGIPGGLRISWPGRFINVTTGDDIAAPADFDHVEIHVAPIPDFVPSDATQVTTMRSTRGERVEVSLPLQRFYVRVVAVSTSGVESTPSDLTFGDPQPIAFTTDGQPPAAAGAPQVIGGVGAIHVRWEGVTNQSEVTYDVHVSTVDGFAPSPSTKVTTTSATSTTVRALADGTPLTSGDEANPNRYYVRIVTNDADGPGGASPQGSATLYRVTNDEISASYAYLGNLTFDQMTGGNVNATAILAGMFATSLSGQRVTFSNDGITGIGPDGRAVFDLPSRPSADGTRRPATFRGEAEFDSVTINNNLSLRGQANEVSAGSTITLASGATPPAQPPTAAVTYSGVSLAATPYWDADQYPVGWAHYSAAARPFDVVLTASSTGSAAATAWLINRADGALLATAALAPKMSVVGMVPRPDGDGFVVLGINIDGGSSNYGGWELRWYRVATSAPYTLTLVSTTVVNLPPAGSNTFQPGRNITLATIAHDGYRAFGIATHSNGSNGSTPALLITAYTFPANPGDAFTTAPSLNKTLNTAGVAKANNLENYLGPVASGNFDGRGSTVNGSNAYYVVPLNGAVIAFAAASTASSIPQNTTLRFPAAATAARMTFCAATVAAASTSSGFDWSYEGFRQLIRDATTQVLYSDGNYIPNGSTEVWWAAHAWYNTSSGYTTRLGPKKAVTPVSRSMLVLSVPAIPSGNPNDPAYVAANNPNAVRFFIGKGTASVAPADSSMWLQPDAVATDTLISITSLATSGTSAPTNGTFPQSSGAIVRSNALRVDGRPRTQISGDGTARIDGLVLVGLIIPYAGPVPSGADFNGYLLCDGAQVMRSTYQELSNVIGSIYGQASDNANYMLLPDLRGRMPIGAYSSVPLGGKGGSSTVTLTAGQLPQHTHPIPFRYAANTTATGAVSRITDINGRLGAAGTDATASTDVNGGSPTPVDVTNPYLAINWLIKW